MSNALKISAWALSVQGSEINQDNVYVNGHYFAQDSNEEVFSYNKASNVEFQMYGVCDGDNQGDPNYSPAYSVMQRLQHLQSVLSADGTVTRDKIWSFLCDTNDRIRDLQSASGLSDISSTFAGLFLQKNRGLVVHLGDSRVYVIRGGRMLQITEDHLESNDLYKLGVITQQQAEVHKLKSKPTAKLGMRDIYEVEASVFSKYFVFYPGDIFVLCTDGVTDSISNAAIERTIAGISDPSEIAETLLRMTINKNDDNKSIVVLHVDEVDGEMAPIRETAAAAEAYESAEEQSYEEEAPVEEEIPVDETEETAAEDTEEYAEEETPADYEDEEAEEADYTGSEEATEEEEEDEDEDEEEDEEPVKKSFDFRSKLTALAAKVGMNKKSSDDEEEDGAEDEDGEEADEAEEKAPKEKKSFFSRFMNKTSDEKEEEDEESEEDNTSEYEEAAEKTEASVEQPEAEEKSDDYEEDEEDEDDDEDDKKSPILGFIASMKEKLTKKKEEGEENEEASSDEKDSEDEDEEDEELSILDKIFADPKKILGILAGIVVLILLIVLLSTKGCKSGNTDNSSVEESSLIEESSSEESVDESSVEESSVEESSVEESSAEESSVIIDGYTKTEDEGKKEHPTDLPEESSQEESYEESSEEPYVPEESSIYYPPQESSTYYPPQESSYVDPVKYITIQEGGYVTYWDIIVDYYGEWSDDVYHAFCRYNGIEVDSPLIIGQVLAVPPISYLDL